MSRAEHGYSLVALMATVTIMMVMMAAAVPAWKYVVKNDREEELIFRGGQIADAVRRFQAKNGNALPPSLDVLVKGKFLRKAFKDPMVKDGKWRLIRQGETLVSVPQAGRAPGQPGAAPSASPGLSAAIPRPSGPSTTAGGVGGSIGVFLGVSSLSTEKGLRLFNNRQAYNEWWFVAGQPRVVGRRVVGGVQAQPGVRGQPGQPQPLQPQPRPGPAQPLR